MSTSGGLKCCASHENDEDSYNDNKTLHKPGSFLDFVFTSSLSEKFAQVLIFFLTVA
jgi:hypothetical protein